MLSKKFNKFNESEIQSIDFGEAIGKQKHFRQAQKRQADDLPAVTIS